MAARGAIIIQCDGKPLAYFRAGNPLDPGNHSVWQALGNEEPELIQKVQNHVVPCRDLIAAVTENRQPVCGLEQGATTIEMVMAVFESHLKNGESVPIPLKNRNHPLKP